MILLIKLPVCYPIRDMLNVMFKKPNSCICIHKIRYYSTVKKPDA